MSDTDNPIEKVRARLDGGRKWRKGQLGDYDDPNASVCLRGAIYSVIGTTFAAANHRIAIEEPLRDTIREQYPDRRDYSAAVPTFNDHPDTTWADVELVLDKASIAWDETVR